MLAHGAEGGAQQRQKSRFRRLIVLLGAIVFLWISTILPRTTTRLFASPDETAVAVFARGWTWTQGFSIHSRLPESLADIGGLHPRSMVGGAALVPVGFLGMPLMMAPLEWLWQGSGAFLMALLVLSSAYPLWNMMERFGRRAAAASVLTYLSFPTVLLYANRGFFPNLPVVALALWGVFLLTRQPDATLRVPWSTVVGAGLVGWACVIRPTEAIWLLPWAIWACWTSPGSRKIRQHRALFAVAAFVFICLIGYAAAVRTYGTWTPTIGYWVHDPVVSSAGPVVVPSEQGGIRGWIASMLPFGMHPRAIWENIRRYLFGILGPWVAVAAFGLAAWMRRRQIVWNAIPVLLTGWTAAMLLLLYGSSLYADNIRGNVTLGNSFLRYLLPLVPLIAAGIGLCAEEVMRTTMRWRFFAIGMVAFFIVFGTATSLFRDEESILFTQRELLRYEEIRTAAGAWLPSGTVVLSDRSDKIFAGAFAAVSPMPSPDALRKIRETGTPMAIFTRTLDADGASFANGALGDLTDPSVIAMPFGNETLYILPPSS